MKVDFEDKRAFLNGIFDFIESSNANDYFWYDKKDDRICTVADIRRKNMKKKHINIEYLTKIGYIKLPYIEPAIILDFYSDYLFWGFDEIFYRIKSMHEDDAFEYIYYLSIECGFYEEIFKIDDYFVCEFLRIWCEQREIVFTPVNRCTYEDFLKTKEIICGSLKKNGYIYRAMEPRLDEDTFIIKRINGKLHMC